MLGSDKDATVEVVCPKCNEKVKVPVAKAETGLVKCSKGHEIALVKAL
jgi:hypothetical protein